jgi:hypothetical protein
VSEILEGATRVENGGHRAIEDGRATWLWLRATLIFWWFRKLLSTSCMLFLRQRILLVNIKTRRMYSSSSQLSRKGGSDSLSTAALRVIGKLKVRLLFAGVRYWGLECRESGRRFGLVGKGAEFDVGPTTDEQKRGREVGRGNLDFSSGLSGVSPFKSPNGIAFFPLRC